MLIEINKSGATTKIRASVESNAVKHLKSCRTVIVNGLFHSYPILIIF